VHRSNIVVHKYGGSSLSTPEKIGTIAEQVVAAHRRGEAVAVVVSAMGSTTNELLDLARSVTTAPPERELDTLLSSGERISTALMAMAIERAGVPAASFTDRFAAGLSPELRSEIDIAADVGSVAVVGFGVGDDLDAAAYAHRALERESIPTAGCFTEPEVLTCVVPRAQVDAGVRAIHRAFIDEPLAEVAA
jgi:aspartokinase